jgi:hypothetical protein
MKVPIRVVIVIIALAVGIVPAAAIAHGPGNGHPQSASGHNKSASSKSTPSPRSQAEKQCRQERTTMGQATFEKAFGAGKNGKNAFGKCVSHRTRQDQSSQQSAQTSSEKTCRSEQTTDPAAFQKKYGTNQNGNNAFGKCVSSHAQTLSQNTESSEVKAEDNAAKQCRSEQSTDPAAFQKKYGTNQNGNNAFGKCVSQKARQQEQQTSTGSGGGSGSTGS